MKKERKKGRLKAWWNDCKRQREAVEKCYMQNKKAFVIDAICLILLSIEAFVAGIVTYWAFWA